ncbi:MAG: MBL fold metallo-hydrolase [Actinomycetota bacterium]
MATLRITPWRLAFANAFLIEGRRPVLVDTGPPLARRTLLRRLRRSGLAPADLGAVVLTHAHADHVGNAAIFADAGVPVVVGTPDVSTVERGRNPKLQPTGIEGRLLKPLLQHRFREFAPSNPVPTSLDLSPFGIDGEFRTVGGHTPGSGVLVTEDAIFAGDLVGGGFFFTTVRRDVATVSLFTPDRPGDLRTLAGLIDEHRAPRVLVGHGGPLDADTTRRRIDVMLDRLDG